VQAKEDVVVAVGDVPFGGLRYNHDAIGTSFVCKGKTLSDSCRERMMCLKKSCRKRGEGSWHKLLAGQGLNSLKVRTTYVASDFPCLSPSHYELTSFFLIGGFALVAMSSRKTKYTT
jgi:hypothetical protein